MTDKTLSLISLCRKAGRLRIGFDPVTEAVCAGEVCLVLTASDFGCGVSPGRQTGSCRDDGAARGGMRKNCRCARGCGQRIRGGNTEAYLRREQGGVAI